tara:strand:+ start:541 stop:1113 length:573 start_codon:yes stop_codon:yes gene_type:complete
MSVDLTKKKKRVAPFAVAPVSDHDVLQTIVSTVVKFGDCIDRGEKRVVYQLRHDGVENMLGRYCNRVAEMARKCTYMDSNGTGVLPENFDAVVTGVNLKTIELHIVEGGSSAQNAHVDNADNGNYFTAIINVDEEEEETYGTQFLSPNGWWIQRLGNIVFNGSVVHRGPATSVPRKFLAFVFTPGEDPNG